MEKGNNNFGSTEGGYNSGIEKVAEKFKSDPDLAFVQNILDAYPESRIAMVGGAVRDGLLDIENKDHDLIIEGVNKNSLEVILGGLGKVDLIEGRNFGVYKFRPKIRDELSKDIIYIALPRTEVYMERARQKHAEVSHENVSIEDDFSRRDFTINAIGMDLRKGNLIDPLGGYKDLKKGIIRAVGSADERFLEDPSRMLRAIRFASQLNFEIEENTFNSIKTNREEILKKFTNEKGLKVERVPWEKIGEELYKSLIFNPLKTIELMDKAHVLNAILPEIQNLKGVEQPKIYHSEGDVFKHTMMLLKKLWDLKESDQYENLFKEAVPQLNIAGLFHDIGKPATKSFDGERIRFNGHDKISVEMFHQLADRLKWDNGKDNASWLIKKHMRMISFSEMGLRKQKQLARDPRFPSLILLTLADTMSSFRPDGTTDTAFLSTALEILDLVRKETAEGKHLEIVNGNEVIDIIQSEGINYRPEEHGWVIGQIKTAVNEAYDRAEIHSKEEAEEKVKEMLKQMQF